MDCRVKLGNDIARLSTGRSLSGCSPAADCHERISRFLPRYKSGPAAYRGPARPSVTAAPVLRHHYQPRLPHRQ